MLGYTRTQTRCPVVGSECSGPPGSTRGHICGKRVLNSLGFKPGTNLVGNECSGPPGFKPGTYLWEASAQFTGIQTWDKFSGKRMLRCTGIQTGDIFVGSEYSIHWPQVLSWVLGDSNPGHSSGKRVLKSTGIQTRGICNKGEASPQIRRYSNLRYISGNQVH